MSLKIPLTKGFHALIDDEDEVLLIDYGEWHVQIKPNGKMYAIGAITSNGKLTTRRLHRVLMGAKPGDIVDHINGDGLDNRRANLRLVSASENARNRAGSGAKPFKGVRLIFKNRKGKPVYSARIARRNRKPELIGCFNSIIEAAKAYDTEALKIFGPHAWTNFVQPGESMKLGQYLQQGDLIIKKIKSLPADLELQSHKILQHGEVTNHCHQFAHDAAVKVYHSKRDTNSIESLNIRTITTDEGKFLVVEAPSLLKHEEHKALQIEPGVYQIDIVREFCYETHEAVRVVD